MPDLNVTPDLIARNMSVSWFDIFNIGIEAIDDIFGTFYRTYGIKKDDCFHFINYCSDKYWKQPYDILDRMILLHELSPNKIELVNLVA